MAFSDSSSTVSTKNGGAPAPARPLNSDISKKSILLIQMILNIADKNFNDNPEIDSNSIPIKLEKIKQKLLKLEKEADDIGLTICDLLDSLVEKKDGDI